MHSNKRSAGFTLVEIMIVVSVIAVLAAIAIPNLLRARLNANEAVARSTVRAISTAAEAYATANAGVYPNDETDLIGAAPPYMNKSYCGTSESGYDYTCNFDSTAGTYEFIATPTSASTGIHTFTVTTGGVFTQS